MDTKPFLHTIAIKMMNRIIFCCLMVFVVFQTNAQQQTAALVVYATTGKAEAKQDGKIKKLTKGMVIKSSATITTSKGDDVMFICSNYNIVRIKQPGSYAVTALINKCAKPSGSVTTAYLQYVWEEFTHKHEKVTDNHKKYMRTTGAVGRGCQGIDINPGTDTLNYFSGQWTLAWTTADGVNVKGFALYDDLYNGRKIADTAISGYRYNIATLLKKVKTPGDYYLLTVVDAKVSCERQYIRVYDKAEFNEVLINLKKQVVATDKAESFFMLGFLLEHENFYAEALQYYKKAILAAPKNNFYKTRYNLFKSTFYQ